MKSTHGGKVGKTQSLDSEDKGGSFIFIVSDGNKRTVPVTG